MLGLTPGSDPGETPGRMKHDSINLDGSDNRLRDTDAGINR